MLSFGTNRINQYINKNKTSVVVKTVTDKFVCELKLPNGYEASSTYEYLSSGRIRFSPSSLRRLLPVLKRGRPEDGYSDCRFNLYFDDGMVVKTAIPTCNWQHCKATGGVEMSFDCAFIRENKESAAG